MRRCRELRAISASPGAYTRLYLTDEHRRAADLISHWMRQAGLAARMDAAGNVIGRIDGTDATAPALVLASHLDTVRDAGTYDGQLGVVTAIEAAAALIRRADKEPLPFPLEVQAYADEEGTRFHTMLLGSGFVTGLEDASVLAKADSEGVTISEAMKGFGLTPERIGDARRQAGDFRAYIEVHIEQGPVLEAEGLPLGTVTAIAGQIRAVVRVRGMAGHAGTVPMAMRRDALAASAEAILAIEAVAKAGADLVATVGEIQAGPGASNVIAGETRFTLDLRSGNGLAKAAAFEEIERRLREIGTARRVVFEIEVGSNTGATACDPGLIECIDEACEAVQGRSLHLLSGAGHDAIALAGLCPIGMIFVRCEGGISHNPAENITEADAGAAFAALLHAAQTVIRRG
ncbi:allantoate deiminase [Faunimonas pinastri]|uniref:Allantoate deiminase n=2 Tax=Faunimonas pinastri TaxID=1855383 RepID=A0A1H9KVN4_9HYPH|nr:allantoate deiminase [Faunimonas pinastri]